MDVHACCEMIRSLERRIERLESILMRPPAPDFTKEDAIVRGATAKLQDAEKSVGEAKGRIPHP